jgi:hypothetical protein
MVAEWALVAQENLRFMADQDAEFLDSAGPRD